MKKIRVFSTLGCFLLLFILRSNESAYAQVQSQQSATSTSGNFELKNKDRVVFLGNSIFENDLQFSYLEFALSSRWPHSDVRFRNIGWTGDNVFGDARTYVTKPPTSYETLISQITKTKPTIVFVAYGGIESQEGKAGLPRFREGMNQLLDQIDKLGAKSILLSPIEQMGGATPEYIAQRNQDIKLYSDEIKAISAARKKQFIDVLTPLKDYNQKTSLSENGIHLNETGYYVLAEAIEKALGLTSNLAPLEINVGKQGVETKLTVRESGDKKDITSYKFAVEPAYLPLPIPAGTKLGEGQKIKVTGLKKGFYALTINGEEVLSASAQKWAEGLEIKQGDSYNQSHQLRELITKKNELFFYQYRPQNRTYILGFRSYEQGRHSVGLDELSLIIHWLESQIATSVVPKAQIFQLKEIK